MSNINYKVMRNLSFGVLTTLFVLVMALAITTYTFKGTTMSPLFLFAMQNHLAIMFGLALISVAFGFYLATLSSTEIERKDKQSKNVLDVVLLFLGADEKKIIDFLVKNNGATTQAEISRIDGMGRVRAFRSVKKLADKNIIEITSHGKIRKVALKETILDLLVERKET